MPKVALKVNAGKMAEDGFKVVEAVRPQTAKANQSHFHSQKWSNSSSTSTRSLLRLPTVLQNHYAKETLVTTTDTNNVYLGNGSSVDDDVS